MSFEQVGLIYEARNASKFASDVKTTELAMRQQAKALNDGTLALQKEVQALKSAEQPNLKLIRSKQLLIQQNRLATQSIRSQIQTLKLEEKAAKGAAGANEKLAKSVGFVGGAFQKFLGPITAALSVLSAGAILKTADDMKVLQGRVQNATKDTGDFAGVYKELLSVSKATGTQLEDSVEVFQRLALAAKDLGQSNQDVLVLEKSVEQLGVIGGSSTEAMKAGLLQFGQAMSAGIVRAEEFNSVVENLPALAARIAKGLGVSTGQLRQLVLDGKVLSKDVFKVLLEQADDVQEEFNKMPFSLSRAANAMSLSLADMVSAFDELLGGTGSVAEMIANLSKGIDELTKFMRTNKAVIQDLVQQLAPYLQLVTLLIPGMYQLIDSFQRLSSKMGGVANLAPLITGAMATMAAALDNVTTSAQLAGVEIERTFRKALAVVQFNRITDPSGALQAQVIAGIDSRYDTQSKAISGGLSSRNNARLRNVYNAVTASGSSVSDAHGDPAAIASKAKKKKAKKGQGEKVDRELLQSIDEDFATRLQFRRGQTNLNTQLLGSFPDQKDILLEKLTEEKNIEKILREKLSVLNTTAVKTKEGQKELSKSLAQTNNELVEQVASVQEATNALTKYKAEQESQDLQRANEIKLASIEQIRSREVAATEEVTENLAQEFADRKLTIDQYYAYLQKQLDEELLAEKEASRKKLEILDSEIADAKKKNDQAKVKDLEKDKELIAKGLEDTEDNIKRASDKLNNDKTTALKEPGRQFADSVGQALNQAINDALTGQNPLNAIKTFAKNIYKALSTTIADALTEAFKLSPLYQSLKDFGATLANQLSGQTKAPVPGGATGTNLLAGLSGKSIGLGLLGGAMLAGGQFLSGKQGTAAGLGGLALGAGGGALTGAVLGSMLLPGIGTLGGALLGGLAGGASSVSQNANTGGFFSTKAGVITAFALGGPLGLLTLGAQNKARQARRAKETAKNEAKNTAFANSILTAADPNNLFDLQQRISQLQAEWSSQQKRGKTGKQPLRDAIDQLLQAVKEREKAIAEFIKDISHQNDVLEDQIRLADAKPFDKAKIEREIAIKEIEYDTARLLDAFKDSEEAKTKILEQEALRRQQLNKEEADAAKESIDSLKELLEQRDAIENSNVFTRRKSIEQLKSDQLQGLDKQLAEKFLEIQGQLNAGINPSQTEGMNQILAQLQQVKGLQANMEVIINQANDPNMVKEEFNRAFDKFYQKLMGVQVA